MDRLVASSVLALSAWLAGCGGAASPEPTPTGPVTVSTGGEAPASNQNTPAGTAGGAHLVASDPQLHAGPAEGMARASEGPAVALEGIGMDREHPVPACGPRDSYDYVASRFRCPDGTNPLGGDPRAGQAARLGNVGANASGHIIDVYRVPCASGPVDVYVDMYGCPGMQGMLAP
jgi:hypothetical protein